MSVRKDYPFSRRNYKFGERMLFTPFIHASKILYSTSRKTNYQDEDFIEIFKHGWGNDIQFSSCKIATINTILCLLYIFSIISIIGLCGFMECWLFPTIMLFFIWDFIVLIPTAIPMLGNITECFIFHAHDLKRQIKVCKYISTIWVVAFIFHLTFYFTLLVLLSKNGVEYYSWNQNIEPSFLNDIILKLDKSSFLTDFSIIFHFSVKIILFFYFLYIRFNLRKLVSENTSFKVISDGIFSVDINLLLDILEGRDNKVVLVCVKDCKLSCIENKDLLKSGFVLKCPDGKVYEYYFNKYVTSQIQLIKNRDIVLSNVCKEINSKFRKYNVSY